MKSFRNFFAVSLLLFASVTQATVQYSSSITTFNQTNKCASCDLSNMNWSTMLKNGNHSGALLAGANLSNNIFATGLGNAANLSAANLTSANLSNATTNGIAVNFSQANLTQANLSGANLINANFSQCNLAGANFVGANLSSANLYKAQNANLIGAKLCHAILPNGVVNNKC